ncbi:MAG: putative metal-binding motif-containing protein [Myxococcota bacterium]|jgi:hypothetical protein|nr:putative metal-binding motif-containing protein [Myxococcota bacterium]
MRTCLGIWLLSGWGLVFGACGSSGGAEGDASVDGRTRCNSDVECSNAIFCDGLEVCAPALEGADARGCVAGTPPCREGFCLEGLRECSESCVDADGDGYSSIACGGSDCDDDDPDVSPDVVEVCDVAGIDEDCNPTTFGERDADGDGAVDAACCNGARCGTDCDDTDAAVFAGASEICNGVDDDCDASIDERFECSSADDGPRACRTSCGSLGTQRCTSACVFSACLAEAEGPDVEGTCNRCDDDGDGAIDEGFECTQGALVTCTTQCGTDAVGLCTASCTVPGPTPAACRAPVESCNYCDDDGDGTFEDDRGLVEPAPVEHQITSCAELDLRGGAVCVTGTYGDNPPFEGNAVLLSDGSATSAGQAWWASDARVGWGALSATAAVFATDADVGEIPSGGVALVLATSACGVGPFNAAGVPLDCEGIAIERYFPFGELVIRRLEGGGEGTVLGEPSLASGLVPGEQTRVGLSMSYTPDLPSTPEDETFVSAMGITRTSGFGIGEFPDGELRVGDPVFLGVVSATAHVQVEVVVQAAFQFSTLDGPRITANVACAP